MNIPKRYQAGVSEIRKLDPETAQKIRTALDKVFSTKKNEGNIVQPSDMAATALTAIPDNSNVDFKALSQALVALYSVKSQLEKPIEEFADEVAHAMELLSDEQLRVPADTREQFTANLITLLNADLFSLAAKAHDLQTDDERTFCSARILTDMRPVFGPRIEDGPKAMVVIHQLKLGYHQGNDKHQQFYVALDAQDLAELKRVIDRAEAKARTLKEAVKATQMFGIPKEQ
jgi:hypothetical protein